MTNNVISIVPKLRNQETLLSEEYEVKQIEAIAHSRDYSAFEKLYHCYRSRLGSFLLRYLKNHATVDEVFNDVMLVVWNKAGTFNHQSKVSTWIYAIAYRVCLGRLRKGKKHLSVVSDEIDHTEAVERKSESKSFETKDLIQKALLSVSPNHRIVLELAYFQGLNYAEIAEVVDCPENTVKTRMFHARKKLHQVLNELES